MKLIVVLASLLHALPMDSEEMKDFQDKISPFSAKIHQSIAKLNQECADIHQLISNDGLTDYNFDIAYRKLADLKTEREAVLKFSVDVDSDYTADEKEALKCYLAIIESRIQELDRDPKRGPAAQHDSPSGSKRARHT